MREIVVEGAKYIHDYQTISQLLEVVDGRLINIALSWHTDYETVDNLQRQVGSEEKRVDVIVAALIRNQLANNMSVSIGYPKTNLPETH